MVFTGFAKKFFTRRIEVVFVVSMVVMVIHHGLVDVTKKYHGVWFYVMAFGSLVIGHFE